MTNIAGFGSKNTNMTHKQSIVIESNAACLALKGAEIFSRAAKESIGVRGRFAVAISGGSTPRPMHRLLGKESV